MSTVSYYEIININYIVHYGCTVASQNFMAGASFGWLSPTLHKYKNTTGDFSLTDDECSWTVAFQFFGVFVGCIVAVLGVDRCGRNAMISLSAILISLSWISVALTKQIVLYLLSRFAFGISGGVAAALIPTYVAENSSPTVRGAFGSICLLFYFGGVLTGCILATYCSYETVAYIFIGISLINLSSIVLVREPAQYLLAKGREVEAEHRFFWLRGEDEKTKNEFEDIKMKMAKEKPEFSFSFILDSRFRKACTITSLSFLTGNPAILSMVSIAMVPTIQFSSDELSILFFIMQAIGALISPLIIDHFRRRTLWITSTILIVIFHCFSAFIYFSVEESLHFPNYEWWLFGSIAAYGVIFSGLTFPLGMVARAELLPQKFRSIGSSSTIIVNALIGSFIGHSFLWIANSFGMKMNFIYFAISSVALLLYCYFYLPETRGMTLTEIEKMLEN